MHRPQVKVLDCTIRDGGLINNHCSSDEFVHEAYRALSRSGIDYMEFGYRSSKELCPIQDFGAWNTATTRRPGRSSTASNPG
jgi:4-hydroxy 2-oxovalerate aldolase